jgi:hypothetical protein
MPPYSELKIWPKLLYNIHESKQCTLLEQCCTTVLVYLNLPWFSSLLCVRQFYTKKNPRKLFHFCWLFQANKELSNLVSEYFWQNWIYNPQYIPIWIFIPLNLKIKYSFLKMSKLWIFTHNQYYPHKNQINNKLKL